MSKWIDKKLFEDFQKEKIEEKDKPVNNSFNRSELLWQNPDKGTVDNPKVYEGRFLPDPKGEFYKKYYYHLWKSGETWYFVLCPKSPKSKETAAHDFKTYCPFCAAVSKLYNGSKQDKAQAYQLKRKERFVGNFYVAKDPRDEDRDEEKKVEGNVKLYEFPGKVEVKVKKEITDKNQGYGYQIFDPSSEGRNIIISVLSSKKDKNGKQWPDYSNTDFSRTQSALKDTDEEIEALMSTCTDLVEYIESMKSSKDKMVEILKSEFLWETVEEEAVNHGYVSDGSDSSNESSDDNSTAENEQSNDTQEEQVQEDTQTEDEQEQEEQSTVSDDDLDDDALLAELDDL